MTESLCLSRAALAGLLADTLEGPAAEVAHAHLEQCERCQARRDRLSDNPEVQAWAAETS